MKYLMTTSGDPTFIAASHNASKPLQAHTVKIAVLLTWQLMRQYTLGGHPWSTAEAKTTKISTGSAKRVLAIRTPQCELCRVTHEEWREVSYQAGMGKGSVDWGWHPRSEILYGFSARFLQ